METVNTTKEQLLIDALWEYFSCRNIEERNYTRKCMVRLAIACDRGKQLFNFMLHHIDLYNIKEPNRRRNIRFYFMSDDYGYDKLCNVFLYVINSGVKYDDIVHYITKSDYDTELDIKEYFDNCVVR